MPWTPFVFGQKTKPKFKDVDDLENPGVTENAKSVEWYFESG